MENEMKNLVAMVFLMMAVGSQASYLQETCSNSDGSVKINMGHRSTGIVLATMTFPRDSKTSPVAYDYAEVDVATTDIRKIDTQISSGCDQDSNGFGISSHKTTQVNKVSITKKDGSAFPSGTVAASNGGKTVTAYVVCERFVSYRAYCPVEM